MRLLDLYCGAGGAPMGYYRAGFEVVGVDIRPQPRYPFEFHQADALEYVEHYGRDFDLIAASPPCQAYSVCQSFVRGDYPDLIDATRAALIRIGRPYIIENVVGAPLLEPVKLCGLMFGLKVFRHRLFESSLFLMQMPHPPHGDRQIGVDGFCCVAGSGDSGQRRMIPDQVDPTVLYGRIPPEYRRKTAWSAAMGIDWMTKAELTQAIPPAYTEYLGRQAIRQIGQEKAA